MCKCLDEYFYECVLMCIDVFVSGCGYFCEWVWLFL